MSHSTTTQELRNMLDEIEAVDAGDEIELKRLRAEVQTLARWLARKLPEVFRRYAEHITDEPGHWDNSYPPAAHVARRCSVRMLMVRDDTWSETPTSSGYYHSYTISTDEPGLMVSRDGTLYSRTTRGSAHLGSYAAHPGMDQRDIHISYRPIYDPTLEDLECAAAVLRKLREALTCTDPEPFLSDGADVRIAALKNSRCTDELRRRHADRGHERVSRVRDMARSLLSAQQTV